MGELRAGGWRLSANGWRLVRSSDLAAGNQSPPHFVLAGKPSSRHKPVSADNPSERPVGRLGDSDASRDVNLVVGNRLALANQERFSLQWFAGHRPGDAQSGTELPGSIGQVDIVDDARPPLVHQRDPVERLEGAHENGTRLPRLARDRVEAPVHSVDEIDVGDAGRPVEVLGAGSTTGCGMAREVVFAEVCLRLDDNTTGDPIGGFTLENGTEHVARNELSVTLIEVAPQDFAAAELRARSRAE